MTKQSLTILDRTVYYTVKESARAQRLRIAVYLDGEVVVTKPSNISSDELKRFLELKKVWIIKKLEQKILIGSPELRSNSKKHFEKHRGDAESLVHNKAKHWSKKIGYTYKKIHVKQLKSRWGSCSHNGDLSFNYKIIFLPERLQDYVIIHELIHLKYRNHSKEFWQQLSSIMHDCDQLHEMARRFN